MYYICIIFIFYLYYIYFIFILYLYYIMYTYRYIVMYKVQMYMIMFQNDNLSMDSRGHPRPKPRERFHWLTLVDRTWKRLWAKYCWSPKLKNLLKCQTKPWFSIGSIVIFFLSFGGPLLGFTPSIWGMGLLNQHGPWNWRGLRRALDCCRDRVILIPWGPFQQPRWRSKAAYVNDR